MSLLLVLVQHHGVPPYCAQPAWSSGARLAGVDGLVLHYSLTHSLTHSLTLYTVPVRPGLDLDLDLEQSPAGLTSVE